MKILSPQILASYIGCEVHDDYHNRVATLIGVKLNPDVVYIIAKNTQEERLLHEVTPILLPISSITDEHLDFISKEILFDKGHLKDILCGRFLPQELSFRESVYVTSFLRAHSYDCDNLIADGLAIDKTTLK